MSGVGTLCAIAHYRVALFPFLCNQLECVVSVPISEMYIRKIENSFHLYVTMNKKIFDFINFELVWINEIQMVAIFCIPFP